MIRSAVRSGLKNFFPTVTAKTNNITRSAVDGGTQFVSGDYVYKRFTASGTISVSGAPLVCDLLIVAGGASGGHGGNQLWAGGGGAGGLLLLENQIIALGSHVITVGAGGAAPSSSQLGNNGSNSSISGFTAAVGGGGGGTGGQGGKSGGNGGGGSGTAGGGAGTSGQGNNGGAAGGNTIPGGGGGWNEPGGAKSVSVWSPLPFASTLRPNGGIGLNAFDWGQATSTGGKAGNSVYLFANGGTGGMASSQFVTYLPGQGFGGGINIGPAANTGSGGFGEVTSASAGASGIVIVRYRKELVGL